MEENVVFLAEEKGDAMSYALDHEDLGCLLRDCRSASGWLRSRDCRPRYSSNSAFRSNGTAFAGL
jgi:hypothetical protein